MVCWGRAGTGRAKGRSLSFGNKELLDQVGCLVQLHPDCSWLVYSCQARQLSATAPSLREAGQRSQDRLQEPLQGGFHWASDLGEVMWQFRTAEILK